MAKTIAPLLSLTAKGNISKVLNFATVRGVTYARKLKPKKAPFDPKSDIQIFNRIYFKNVILLWQNLEESEKDYFGIYANTIHMSGFNLFTKEYIEQKPSDLGMVILGVSRFGALKI